MKRKRVHFAWCWSCIEKTLHTACSAGVFIFMKNWIYISPLLICNSYHKRTVIFCQELIKQPNHSNPKTANEFFATWLELGVAAHMALSYISPSNVRYHIYWVYVGNTLLHKYSMFNVLKTKQNIPNLEHISISKFILCTIIFYFIVNFIVYRKLWTPLRLLMNDYQVVFFKHFCALTLFN